jgi:hypothetical protein
MENPIYALADEIQRMTGALTLTGQPDNAEQEIEAFVSLMEKREPMIQHLTGMISEARRNATKKISNDTKQKINDIITMDRENIRIMEHIKKSVQSSIKEIKSGRRLSNAYTHPLEETTTGSFEAKQ